MTAGARAGPERCDNPAMLWLAYLVGSVGVLVEWRSYMLACGTAFRRWSAAGAVLWSLMYMLLGAWTAALTMAGTALRTLLSGHLRSRRQKHLAAGGFVALFVLLTALSWAGWVSLLPAFAVINTTLALFYLGNRNMRIALLPSSVAWIANDILWQAWPSLLAEVVAALLNLRTIHQLRGNADPPTAEDTPPQQTSPSRRGEPNEARMAHRRGHR